MSIKALAEVLVEEIGCSKNKAMRAVSAMFDSISQETSDGKKITIKGFGTFRRVTRVARSYDTPYGKSAKPERRFLNFRCVNSQKRIV